MAFSSLQRFAIRRLLSLPSPLLRLASGGAATYRGGRTLEPRMQALGAGGDMGLAALTPAEAREQIARRSAILRAPPERGVAAAPLAIAAADREIGARLYRPDAQDPTAPLLVFAHDGGGVLGDLDACDGLCRILARILRGPVISIDYRLAPEHRFPAGRDDVIAASRWARDQAARFGAPAGAVMVGGEGIGAAFAAAACQDFKRLGEPQPMLQMLFYPWTDIASETPSMNTHADAFPLSRATLDWLVGHYLGPQDDPGDPGLSPLRAASVAGLAPAVVATAGFDPLADQGEAYAQRLAAAGVPLAYRRFDALTHGFAAFAGPVPAADAACREVAELARDMLDGRTA